MYNTDNIGYYIFYILLYTLYILIHPKYIWNMSYKYSLYVMYGI